MSLAFDGVDSARITGKFYAENTPALSDKAASETAETKNVNVVPASSVYFDDDLVSETVTVGDGSGYNASIEASSPDAVNVAAGVYRFTFKGTGIDIYCTTYLKDADGTEAWFAQAKVDNGKVQTMAHQSGTVRYNVPTFTFRDLPYGEHTLVMNITNASNYKLDGIRVYGAVNDQSVYENTNEQYATYISMRETLVNNASTYDVFTNEMTKEQIGSLFVDSVANMSLYKQPISGRTGEPIEGAEPVQVYANEFVAYQKNSPKHEIYLDTNQAIVFALTQDAYDAAAAGNLWIGLSAPDKGTGTGTVTLVDVPKVQKIDVTSGVDMYYPITKDMIGEDNVVTIKNTGDSLISVTNLKITGNEDIYKAAQTTPAEGSDTPGTRGNLFQMVFAPITMQTVKVAANGGVDPDAVIEPDVPEQPGVPDMPDQPGEPDEPTVVDTPSATDDPTDPVVTDTPNVPDDPTDPTAADTPSVPDGPTDPGAPSNPDTPDEPDDGKPGWNDDAFNPVSVLRALFKLLLQSLSSLFNGLGDW